jgi:hypothetical protein
MTSFEAKQLDSAFLTVQKRSQLAVIMSLTGVNIILQTMWPTRRLTGGTPFHVHDGTPPISAARCRCSNGILKCPGQEANVSIFLLGQQRRLSLSHDLRHHPGMEPVSTLDQSSLSASHVSIRWIAPLSPMKPNC